MDMLYGHRRDPQGYANCLHEFDEQLKPFLEKMKHDDLLMISADHGLDPTYKGTDHTREMVPLLAYSPSLGGKNLGTINGFTCIGATACAALGAPPPPHGKTIIQ